MPIDFFFRSLAQDLHEKSIGVVLSGTGSDGTNGVRYIKGEGGLAVAQTPETTEYDGMPRSAIATGLMDYILAPTEMLANIISYIGTAFTTSSPYILSTKNAASPNVDDVMKKIFVLLRAQTTHDFSQYKQNTIRRRVQRRLTVHKIDNIENYLRFLQRNPAEVSALFRDLLIGVTSFFRDPDLFESLNKNVIARIVANTPTGGTVRCWTPGCSTGEEAYSLAILFLEQMNAQKKSLRIQMFATDIDADAINIGRSGVFTASIATDLTVERLEHYFYQDPDSDKFHIAKTVRDLLVFSEQDLIKDPPFSKLDLISCRNLLIYMGVELQKKVIPLFHYALNSGGYLFLGNSESVGEHINLFVATDRKAKIFQRIDNFGIEKFPQMPTHTVPLHESGKLVEKEPKRTAAQKIPVRELTERALLEHAALNGALVNARGDIFYIHGKTGRYLEPSAGETNTMNILKMVREELRSELTTSLYLANKHREPVLNHGLQISTNGSFSFVNLTIRPVTITGDNVSHYAFFVVIFQESDTTSRISTDSAQTPNLVTGRHTETVDQRIAELKEQLRAKEEYLQSTNEELETSNEELKSSSEEMQSVNEELQSTNEELETSKEELQSVNEELATVNAELQQKVTILSQTNNDMLNLLSGTGIGTIFVDLQMRILRYTASVTHVIPLIKSDIGRPLGNIVTHLPNYPHIEKEAKSVLDTLIPKEIEVQSNSDKFFLLRFLPYRTIENTIEGVVITFVDISAIKQAQEIALDVEATGRLLFNTMPVGVTLHDSNGRITDINPAGERILGMSAEQMKGTNLGFTNWEQFKEDGTPLAQEDHPVAVAIRTGCAVNATVIGFRYMNSKIVWIRTRVAPLTRPLSSSPYKLCSTFELVDSPMESDHVR
jgi:two-component system CheB/CheR fusion protein